MSSDRGPYVNARLVLMNIPIARVLIVDDEVHSQMRIQFSLEQA